MQLSNPITASMTYGTLTGQCIRQTLSGALHDRAAMCLIYAFFL